MISHEKALKGLKVTVMGLGLHGGGAATARFLASRGAKVRVTDLRSPEILAPSMEGLKEYAVKYTLGRHEMKDFQSADLVFKNPAVSPESPFLKAAKAVETDISLFLRLNRRPLLAITGSKGKSTSASALYHILKRPFPEAMLGEISPSLPFPSWKRLPWRSGIGGMTRWCWSFPPGSWRMRLAGGF